MADWFSFTETDYTGLNESNWEGLSDGTPSSVSGEFYWESIENFPYALLDESQWQGQKEFEYTGPPFIDSGYVNGVCNHSVFIIPN